MQEKAIWVEMRLLSIVLLLSITFNTFHSFVIDAFDAHPCSVSEYVEEFSHTPHNELSGDICELHAAFHVLFILYETACLHTTELLHEAIQTHIQKYTFNYQNNLIKPPRIS